jgi:hypothetical protein
MFINFPPSPSHHPSSPAPAIQYHSFCHPTPVDQPPPADPLAHLKSLAKHAITRASTSREKEQRHQFVLQRNKCKGLIFLWYSRLERETLRGYVLSFFVLDANKWEAKQKRWSNLSCENNNNNNQRGMFNNQTPARHQPHQSAVAVSISSLFISFLFTFCPIPQRLSS